MDDRDNIITFLKSEYPGELIVFRAESLDDQIRFYLNDTEYIAAIEKKEKLGDDEEQNETQNMSAISNETLKNFAMDLFVCMEFAILGLIGISCITEKADSILVLFFVLTIGLFIINIVNVVVIEYATSPFSIRSKHSAEHMMVNFLKINKRLPKSIKEVKECSRFHPYCGSRKFISDIAKDFVRSMYAAMMATCISAIVSCFFDDTLLNVVVILFTYILFEFKVLPTIIKHGDLNYIIEPIIKVLTNVVQCANTTSNVKDDDIILAYSAAKPWLKIVYPEFYNEEEDTFPEK